MWITPPLIVILGPTASGKSALAVEIARLAGGEVVSADSRQVYRGLDIGSGKITKREMRGIPHHLLDIADPKRQFSVARYKKLADRAIADIVKRGRLPILCGGTGFYSNAVAENISLPEVSPDNTLRKELAKKRAPELYTMLQKLDPMRAETVEEGNPRRLIRAIEIAKALGEVPRAHAGKRNHKVLYIGLNPGEQALRENIHSRLLARMGRGMVAEAKKLRARGISLRRMEELGLEYRYLALYLQNKISREAMLQEIEAKSWQFAKRQMRWWKRNEKIQWFEDKSSARRYILRTLAIQLGFRDHDLALSRMPFPDRIVSWP